MRYGYVGYYSGAEAPERPPVSEEAFSTGYWELDEIFKFYPGQFTVVTGIAGHGKSTFMLNVLLNVASKQRRAVFAFLPENEQHIGTKMRRMWTGTEEEWDYIWSQKFFFQFATPAVYNQDYDAECKDIVWVLECAKRAIEKDHVEVVFIDPWNELERAKPRDIMMSDYIMQCLMYVKNFCRNYKVSLIMVAHPTKVVNEGEGRSPRLYDIEGSAGWKNKCDNGLIVIREPGNQVKIKSEKVREEGAGKIGECFFSVDPASGIFTPQHGAVMSGEPIEGGYVSIK